MKLSDVINTHIYIFILKLVNSDFPILVQKSNFLEGKISQAMQLLLFNWDMLKVSYVHKEAYQRTNH